MQDDEIDRELRNWALWHASGGWLGVNASTISGIYSSVGPRYRESSVPVMAGAAWDVDRIVGSLVRELRETIQAWYLHQDPEGRRIPSIYPTARVASLLKCSEWTYRRRLAQGQRQVRDELIVRRRRSEALRRTNGA